MKIRKLSVAKMKLCGYEYSMGSNVDARKDRDWLSSNAVAVRNALGDLKGVAVSSPS